MNKKIIGLILIIGVVFIVGCKQEEEIKIGALFPLTGGLSQYGEVAERSAAIALEEINEAGGINGKNLVIDFQDHQCNSQQAVSNFEQMRSVKGIQIFTSVACSGTVLSLAPMLEDKNALLLGTIVTSPKITGSSPNVFRNWASDDKEAKLFSEEIIKMDLKKIGVIYEETDYAKGLKLSLDKYLEGSGIEIVSESFVSDAVDVRTQVAKLQNAELDLLFISPQTVTNADKVLKQMAEAGFKPKILFVNDNIIKASNLISEYPEILEDAVGADYVIAKGDEALEFLGKYEEKYGEPCPQENICIAEYDAIKLLAEALKTGESVEDVKDYLKNAEYEGISGIIQFDENNDRDNSEYSLFKIEEGIVVKQ